MKRWGYAGKTFTTADNPRLPYPIRILPDATVYAEFDTGARRLNAIVTRVGLAISTLADCQLLITRGGYCSSATRSPRGKRTSRSPLTWI